MSIFGALNTAVSGLTAQSDAFGNISQNIANSQTTGYKEVNTNFVDYLTYSTTTQNQPGSVVALPSYQNEVQGTIAQSSDPLAMAISGQGFFSVAESNGTNSSGQTTFNPLQYYTRAGDFTMNNEGYLVNSAGDYLEGWKANSATGIINQNQLVPIQVNQTQFNPVATSTADFAANLPATPTAGTPMSSQVQIYDALGTQQTLTVNWAQTTTPGQWQVTVSSPNNQGTGTAPTTIATATVDFGPTGADTSAPPGTISGITPGTGATASTATNGQAATLTVNANFGNGTQPITLNFGNYGQANGVTQYAGSTYSLINFSQNGVPAGAFTGIAIQPTGNVVANYNNGQSLTIAQVPITTFNNANALQSQNGQAFTATAGSGNPSSQAANSNGAGGLVVGSVEQSNADIATQFTQLIVAQQAYSANAKSITTASQMLQTAINMIQ
jgi:flagellar hook protein FlgE